MNIYEFLTHLSGVTREGKHYKALCPCHDDHDPSLTIDEGNKGIVVYCPVCHAKGSDVCEKLGIDTKELSYKAIEKSKNKSKALPPWHPSRKDEEYEYTDEKGNIVYWHVRVKNPKDFLFQVPDKNSKYGRIWQLGDTPRFLYRLPAIQQAIKEGKPIYIAEGEKDANTLTRLGYEATTNPDAAKEDNLERYLPQIYGAAHVYILGDHDIAGYEHMLDWMRVFRSDPKAPPFTVTELRKVWDEIQYKNDVTDMCEAVGDKECINRVKRACSLGAEQYELEAQLKRFREIKGESNKTQAVQTTINESVNDDTEAGKAYANVDGYCVHDGWLCQFNADGGLKRLASFAAIPRKEKSKDDGLSVQKGYEIEGFNVGGQSMGTAWVTAKEFPGMNWAIEKWGFRANIMPGNTNKDKIRYAIQACGEKGLVKETIYTHTGWRKIDNKWVYLHSGGAIGAEDIGVQLEGKLESYDMELDKEIDIYDAIEAEKGYFNAMEASIAYPLLAVAYMSPLCEFMNAADIMPKFALYIRGGTQTRKTTAALLTLSHFGHFGSQNKIPASFSDTANSVQRSAFILKDMPLLVDDYYPNGNGQERKRMEAMAQALARAFGNGTTRSRLNSDMALRAGQSPRGMAIFTGEDLPDIKESGLARYFIVNVQRGDIPIGEMLTELQTKARQGYLTRAMSRYIEWLIPQADELPEKLYERYMSYRELVLEKLTAAGARAAETLASMLLSLEMMFEFWKSLGSIEKEDAQSYMTEAWNVLSATAIMQGRENREQKPTVIFLSILSELLGSGEYRCLSLDDDKGPLNVLGYADAEYYYMYPEKSYRAVTKFLADQGSGFPVTLQTLRKMLIEEKYISPEFTSKCKKIKGKNAKYLWLPRPLIDGREEKASQTEMTETDEPAPF